MKYFTIPELTFSPTAIRHGIDNTPSPRIMRNLMHLTDKLLDPVREMWGSPLVITSGYRCKELNNLVGGVTNSQHMDGLAADMVVVGGNPLENYRLYCMIKDSGLPYHQLIAEGKRGSSCKWIHLSIKN